MYRDSGHRDTNGGVTFTYVGEFDGIHIPTVLETHEVAKALGEGTHDLVVGFRANRGTAPLQYIKRKRITVAPAKLRVTALESL